MKKRQKWQVQRDASLEKRQEWQRHEIPHAKKRQEWQVLRGNAIARPPSTPTTIR